jgi:hypothetical protein
MRGPWRTPHGSDGPRGAAGQAPQAEAVLRALVCSFGHAGTAERKAVSNALFVDADVTQQRGNGCGYAAPILELRHRQIVQPVQHVGHLRRDLKLDQKSVVTLALPKSTSPLPAARPAAGVTSWRYIDDGLVHAAS